MADIYRNRIPDNTDPAQANRTATDAQRRHYNTEGLCPTCRAPMQRTGERTATQTTWRCVAGHVHHLADA